MCPSNSIVYLVSAALLAAVMPALAADPAPNLNGTSQVSGYGKLPLSFHVNAGQAPTAVRDLARGNGYSLVLTDNEAVLMLHKPGAADRAATRPTEQRSADSADTALVRMRMVGANPSPCVRGRAQRRPGRHRTRLRRCA